jgi:hypothetical protein
LLSPVNFASAFRSSRLFPGTTASDQSLENLLDRKADLVRNGLRGQVVGIDFVRAEFVRDPHPFQKAHCVGLHAIIP